MDITIFPKKLQGAVQAIPSKSQAHRLMICAAFADKPTTLICPQTNQDIEATADCLRALGAEITCSVTGYTVNPIKTLPSEAVLPCKESGSTLRFLLPVVGALGVSATFVMEGRLPERPLSPLWEEMERMGCRLTRPSHNSISCSGQLRPGTYTIDGGISSQFITGLLFAAALMNGKSTLVVNGTLESQPYVDMTRQTINQFGVCFNGYTVAGHSPLQSPGSIIVEGDWSNAAFFLAAQALGNSLDVLHLNKHSLQGDRAAEYLFKELKRHQIIDASDIPDLVPILSIVAAANQGAEFQNIHRLRLKESDRVESVRSMICSLGGYASADYGSLSVAGTGFTGGIVDSHNDHRIAMAAAIAATVSSGPVTILNAQCVAKSYPAFWMEYQRLGGHYEQYIR